MTHEPLGRIASDCGIFNQSHFVKRFKSATGMRPRDWRRRFAAGERHP